MDNLPANSTDRAWIWLSVTTLVYFFMNGAQIFETAVITPRWANSPPVSFTLLRSLDLKTFWIVMHSFHEITFILAIIFCWKLGPVRNWLLLLFAVHFAVRAWTLVYFAPNIIEFQKIAEAGSTGTDLLTRARLWQTLNYIRVGLFMAVSIGLIPLCIRVLHLKFR